MLQWCTTTGGGGRSTPQTEHSSRFFTSPNGLSGSSLSLSLNLGRSVFGGTHISPRIQMPIVAAHPQKASSSACSACEFAEEKVVVLVVEEEEEEEEEEEVAVVEVEEVEDDDVGAAERRFRVGAMPHLMAHAMEVVIAEMVPSPMMHSCLCSFGLCMHVRRKHPNDAYCFAYLRASYRSCSSRSPNDPPRSVGKSPRPNGSLPDPISFLEGVLACEFRVGPARETSAHVNKPLSPLSPLSSSNESIFKPESS